MCRYWEYQLKPWDMAAGALILTEAGGKVTKGDGAPFNVFAKSIIASNTHLHEQARAPDSTAARPAGRQHLLPRPHYRSYLFIDRIRLQKARASLPL